VPDADRDEAAGARQQPVGPSVEGEDRRALEYVEALLERVQVLVDRAVGLERAQADGHVH